MSLLSLKTIINALFMVTNRYCRFRSEKRRTRIAQIFMIYIDLRHFLVSQPTGKSRLYVNFNKKPINDKFLGYRQTDYAISIGL